MRYLRTAFMMLMAAIVMLTTGLIATAPAQAASRDGQCNTGEFCYYYNSNNEGSISDFTTSIADYGTEQPSCYDFKGDGAGKGRCIKNDAASVWNRTGKTVRVHYNSNYGGASQTFDPGDKRNLNDTLKNNNASHKIGADTSRINLTSGLYQHSGGVITAGFNGYVNTPGKHEGIDMARGLGLPVHALVAGKVINISRGYTGSGGLSTIAVYSAKYDKTVIYLHSKPLAGLSEGQTVARGKQIAVESWRGVSSSSATHTHVEMRPGRQERAALSVGDYTLENPDPTRFWHARGYNIR